MPNFKYKAMNDKGERLEGVYNASSKDVVVEMISSNNYYPLKVEEIIERENFQLGSLIKITTKDIAIFCRQFYTMIDAGISINASLHMLSQQLPNKRLREAVAKVEDEVKKGSTLSEAMMLQRGIFPDLLINMIGTGEISGNLDTIMLRMSTHYQKEHKINGKVKGAMIYPMILGIATVAVIVLILTFILPVFVSMFTSSGVALPPLTRALLKISETIKEQWLFIFTVMLFLVLTIRFYLKTERGQHLINKLKLQLPILRSVNEKVIVSRFTRTLSTVLGSGIPLVQALEAVAGIIGNTIVQKELLKAKDKLVKGQGLAEPIKETGHFPVMLSSMIKIGEESGQLDEILNKTADFYDDELETAIATLTSIIEPLMIVIMGVVAGVLIIAIIQPMFGMYRTIK